jgi:diphosphomevalonate decarboxylase
MVPVTNQNFHTATAVSRPNIAFIKYWGNRDAALRIPVNGSISMNLDGLETVTWVTFDPAQQADSLMLNGAPAGEQALRRVSAFLDLIRAMAGISLHASVDSRNSFPTGAGIASSAAAFSALALAASTAAGLKLDEPSLTRLARRGSGSASRSIPGGFVEWLPGTCDEDSYAFSIAPAGHWDLVDVIAVVAAGEKKVGSTEGHGTAPTSPLQAARVADAPRRLDLCREAVRTRDFEALAVVMELDSDMMHSVMMTSRPPLFYWEPASLRIIKEVPRWRSAGLPCTYTLDAGPNVHILCPAAATDAVVARLEELGGISHILRAAAGGPARLVL